MPTPLSTAATPIVPFKLHRSTNRPKNGRARAETTMKVVTAKERVERLMFRSSDMGFSKSDARDTLSLAEWDHGLGFWRAISDPVDVG